jgi:acetylcholinesterase
LQTVILYSLRVLPRDDISNLQPWSFSLVAGNRQYELNVRQTLTSYLHLCSSAVSKRSPLESEDCLFLDVVVPEDVLSTAGRGPGAPVLVWIYGGGYTAGNKNNNPAGLLAASGNSSNGDVIYVSINYRLGALGFSAGPSFNAEGGVSNAALYDQRFALEWVQRYIHLFGGDRKRVRNF